MAYDFDKFFDRRNTDSRKWDYFQDFFGEEDILPMWVADMDFAVPDEVINALRKRAEHGAYGYTARSKSFYDSIISWIEKRHGFEVKEKWLCFSPGVVPALSMSVMEFTKPGDKVIIQTPVYPPFYSVIESNGRKVVKNPLKVVNGKFTMDFEDLEGKIDKDVKMLILCSPHNPTGRVWTREELLKLGEICIKNDIIIVSDEIHSDVIFKDSRHIPIASLSHELLNHTISCISPSKTFNVAGLYTSLAVIPNEGLRNRFNKRLETLGLGGTNVFGAVAFEAAYRYGEDWLRGLLEYLEGNVKFVLDYIGKNIPQIKAYKPDGTYLMWLDFRGLNMTHTELKEFLVKKARVGLNDGTTFGTEGENHMRLNIGCQRATLLEGLKRIQEAIG